MAWLNRSMTRTASILWLESRSFSSRSIHSWTAKGRTACLQAMSWLYRTGHGFKRMFKHGEYYYRDRPRAGETAHAVRPPANRARTGASPGHSAIRAA